MSLKDFQMLSKLGEGAYSTVYEVKRLIDNQIYALKKVKMNNLTERQKQNALNEVRILASINHPNIISYKQAFIQKGTNYLCIVMEYADDGDLLAKVKEHSQFHTRFSEEEIWSIIIQITQGLKVLHDLKILHRDIKSANIFLNKSGLVKLGDLNVSKLVKSMSQTQTGTPYYASPEIWKDQPYDKKSDIWSLGCVIYEAIALKPPFRANDLEGLYKKVSRGFYSRLPPQYSNDLSVILKQMLQVAPHLRSSCDKLLEYPIIQKNMIFVPEVALVGNSIKNQSNNLMRTIKIDNKVGIDELKNRVELPKARYSQNMTFQQQLIKSSRNVSNFGSIHVSGIKQPKKLLLPSINKTIDYDERDRKQKKKIDKKQIRNDIRQILGSGKSQVLYRGPSNSMIQRYPQNKNIYSLKPEKNQNIDQAQFQQKHKKQINNRPDKRYEGRIKHLSPSVIHKILKNQKQRQKIKSIIGNN